MTRPVHVWRVNVTAYPPRSHWSHWSLVPWDQDWAPEGWNREYAFTWDGRRYFLAEDAAACRAEQLRSWGATVEIERSDRVVWS